MRTSFAHIALDIYFLLDIMAGSLAHAGLTSAARAFGERT